MLLLDNGCYRKLGWAMSDQKINDASVDDKPLVTLGLLACNHEKDIRKAVEGAVFA